MSDPGCIFLPTFHRQRGFATSPLGCQSVLPVSQLAIRGLVLSIYPAPAVVPGLAIDRAYRGTLIKLLLTGRWVDSDVSCDLLHMIPLTPSLS